MEYLSIINDRNIVSINDSYKNIILRSKTPLSQLYDKTENFNGGYFNDYSPFVQAPTGPDENDWRGKSVDIYTFGVQQGEIFAISLKEIILGNMHVFCSRAGTYHIVLTKGTDVQGLYIYIYGAPPKTTTSKCGLIVYNQDGELVFDSNFRYACPIEFGWESVNLSSDKMTNKAIFLPLGWIGAFISYNCVSAFIGKRKADGNAEVWHFHQLTSLSHSQKSLYAIFDVSNTTDI